MVYQLYKERPVVQTHVLLTVAFFRYTPHSPTYNERKCSVADRFQHFSDRELWFYWGGAYRTMLYSVLWCYCDVKKLHLTSCSEAETGVSSLMQREIISLKYGHFPPSQYKWSMPSTVRQNYIHKFPVILHDSIQRESHKPYDAPTSVTWLHDLHLQRCDCRNTLIYAHTNVCTLPAFDIGLGLLTLAAPESRNFVELILLYFWYTYTSAILIGGSNEVMR
jgi:hypothetical protein